MNGQEPDHEPVPPRERAGHASSCTTHCAPLLVTLGAGNSPTPVTTITGYWLGLAKRSIQVA